MNITDQDGLWKITDGCITNRTTNELRRVKNIPSGHEIAYMDYKKFLRKCEIAFNTGEWPQTHWKSGRITG